MNLLEILSFSSQIAIDCISELVIDEGTSCFNTHNQGNAKSKERQDSSSDHIILRQSSTLQYKYWEEYEN
jgi:hypothetical protein